MHQRKLFRASLALLVSVLTVGTPHCIAQSNVIAGGFWTSPSTQSIGSTVTPGAVCNNISNQYCIYPN
jgi:hypothetical protein